MQAPEADVVPRAVAEEQSILWRDNFNSIYESAKETLKAEVAREIFEEIDRVVLINKRLGDRGLDYIYDLQAEIAELKKKYTEEK